jgi:hypothetical protein
MSEHPAGFPEVEARQLTDAERVQLLRSSRMPKADVFQRLLDVCRENERLELQIQDRDKKIHALELELEKKGSLTLRGEEDVVKLYRALASGDKKAFQKYAWQPDELEKLEEMVDIYADPSKHLLYPSEEAKAVALGINRYRLNRWKKTELFATLLTERVRTDSLLGTAAAVPGQAALAQSGLKGSTKAFEALAKISGAMKNVSEMKFDGEVRLPGLESLLTRMRDAKNVTPPPGALPPGRVLDAEP